MAITAYSARKVFTGDQWLDDHCVIVENGWITDIIPTNKLPSAITVEPITDILAPAFIDLQIYGAFGKLLAVYPEADSLFRLNEYCRGGGAAYCLPTVATNAYEVFHKSIDAVRDYWHQGGEGVLGLHLEGPWINPVKKGAHIEDLIHSPSIEQVRDLLEYGRGVIKMITLAPEVCAPAIVELVLSEGIVISAGHSNASYEQANDSFKNGITTVTHLFNAMSPLQHRAPGLVGAVFNDENVMASIIPDGHHVDFAAIRIAKNIMKDRLFVITDAVTETDKGGYQHYLAGDKYEAGGILSGSALTMGKSLRNLVQYAGVDIGEAIRMCSLYPAQVIGLEKELGKIATGFRSKMIVLKENCDVAGVVG